MFRATFSVGMLLGSLALIGNSITSTEKPIDRPLPIPAIPAVRLAPEGPGVRLGPGVVTDREIELEGPLGESSVGNRLIPAFTYGVCATRAPRLRPVAHQQGSASAEVGVVRVATRTLARLPEIGSPAGGEIAGGDEIPKPYRPPAGNGTRLASQPSASAQLERRTAENFRNDDPPHSGGQVMATPSPPDISAEDKESPPPVKLTPQQEARRARIRQCLDFYYHRRALNTKDDGPWSMMHAMLGFDVDSQVHVGGPEGQRTSMIGWLTANRECRGERLLYVRNNAPHARRGPGLQGHDCQFLSMLAQCGVAADHPLWAGDREFTVADLVEVEKAGCRPRAELTFQLISLSHYLPSDATWQTPDGQRWSISRLIREEMAQPINGVTCGGTHRLMAMTRSVNMRRAGGRPVDGDWARALQFTQKYQGLALQLQNRDGSLSCDFFRGRGDWGGVERKLKTTGHTLEWLVYCLPERQLQSTQILRAVDYLTTLMTQNRYYDWEKGPMGHGIRALAWYDQRVFGGQPGRRAEQLAEYRNRPLPSAKVARQPSTSSNGRASGSSRSSSSQRSYGRQRLFSPR